MRFLGPDIYYAELFESKAIRTNGIEIRNFHYSDLPEQQLKCESHAI